MNEVVFKTSANAGSLIQRTIYQLFISSSCTFEITSTPSLNIFLLFWFNGPACPNF